VARMMTRTELQNESGRTTLCLRVGNFFSEDMVVYCC
jgi:hypothetical protein